MYTEHTNMFTLWLSQHLFLQVHVASECVHLFLFQM